jgi:cation diffusion facilitator family transporter
MGISTTATPERSHDDRAHRRLAHRAIVVSALGLLATGAIELALAIFTGSVALLGDALHNLADVATSAVVFVGLWVSKRRPSPAYPYGYERAEDLAGLGIALVIWASAVFAGYESYRKLVSDAGTSHVGIGVIAAVIGIVGNLAVSVYKAAIARRIHSVTLAADARHSWLDMLSSVGALLGLVGVGLGYRWADPVAGAAVTLFIGHVGIEVTGQIVHHLMDGVDPEDLASARAAAAAVAGVHAVVVRGRWMGRSLILEVDGQLDDDVPVSMAHDIGRRVEQVIQQAVPATRTVRWIALAARREARTGDIHPGV